MVESPGMVEYWAVEQKKINNVTSSQRKMNISQGAKCQ
jgi:hypothetical protein